MKFNSPLFLEVPSVKELYSDARKRKFKSNKNNVRYNPTRLPQGYIFCKILWWWGGGWLLGIKMKTEGVEEKK